MRWLLKYLFKNGWTGEVYLAFKNAFVRVECPYCHATFKRAEREVHAGFCDLARAEAISEADPVSIILDGPEFGPTTWTRTMKDPE